MVTFPVPERAGRHRAGHEPCQFLRPRKSAWDVGLIYQHLIRQVLFQQHAGDVLRTHEFINAALRFLSKQFRTVHGILYRPVEPLCADDQNRLIGFSRHDGLEIPVCLERPSCRSIRLDQYMVRARAQIFHRYLWCRPLPVFGGRSEPDERLAAQQRADISEICNVAAWYSVKASKARCGAQNHGMSCLGQFAPQRAQQRRLAAASSDCGNARPDAEQVREQSRLRAFLFHLYIIRCNEPPRKMIQRVSRWRKRGKRQRQTAGKEIGAAVLPSAGSSAASDTNMESITDIIRDSAERGEDLVLVRITKSMGSTPRGRGAQMLVGAEGRVAGTIGGGALEHECEQIAKDVLSSGQETTREFRLDNSSAASLGMVCGGDVDVAFELMRAADLASVDRVAEAAEGGQTKSRVYIFGGGHVAQALVPVLASVDFECIVLEDRPAFAQLDLFPGASEARVIDNERVLDEVSIGPEDRVVIMTRGHENDLLIQSQVMRTPARYIGVIGSERKTETLTRRLREMGFTDSDFERVYAPIGLPIQSETPAEIAISIAAQLILERAGGLKDQDKRDSRDA